jgi:hypothetical protein
MNSFATENIENRQPAPTYMKNIWSNHEVDPTMALYLPWVVPPSFIAAWERGTGQTLDPSIKVERTAEYIKKVFRDLGYGEVSDVALQSQFGSGTEGNPVSHGPFKHYRAQVWFRKWNDDALVASLQSRIRRDGEVRLVHSDPQYWVVKENQFATHREFSLDKQLRRALREVDSLTKCPEQQQQADEVMTAPVVEGAFKPRPRGRPPFGHTWDAEAGAYVRLHKRPPGRPPVGRKWDERQGKYV